MVGLPVLQVLPIICLHFLIPAQCQYPNDPRDQNAITNTFYLTSKSDCGDDLKNIFGQEAYVKGYDLGNLATGPTSCTIKITSTSVYTGVQLELLINAMNILDCDTQLTIYDGQDSGSLLGSYDCRSSQNINRRSLLTSGDTVTFILSRKNPDSTSFDIDVRIRALTSGGGNPDKPGNHNPFDFEKFDQDAIVGMIAGFYALVAVICIAVVIYFYCNFNGKTKKWETHQLQTFKTVTSFDARTQESQAPWSVGTASQRGAPTSQYTRSFTDTYSRKGPAARSEDGLSDVYDHDEKFQKRNLMTQRDRRNGRDRMASQNSVYTDDEPEEALGTFKEKVITPRVRPGGRWRPKNQRPPSFEEATRESSAEESSEEDEETEESSDDNNSTRKRLTTSSEGSYTETESESGQSTGSSNTGARAKKTKSKKAKKKSKSRRRRQSSSDDASSRRTEPRAKQHQPPPQHPAGMPYNPYPPMGGQFVPVMAGPPPQFQPMPMVPPNYQPPQYSMETQGQVKPTDPPVYSYLVRRGYTPMDPNAATTRGASPPSSAASSQRAAPAKRDEPDTQLQSGVEYMRR